MGSASDDQLDGRKKQTGGSPSQTNEKGGNDMPQASTYQCPNCRGMMSYDARLGKLRCAHCGYVPSDEEKHDGWTIPVGNGEGRQRGVTQHAKTVEDFLTRAPWEVSADGTMNAITYQCPACAAEVAADQSVVSMKCPYCGNTMLVSGTATESDIPDYVLPFSVERSEAEERMRRHFEHKWYLPNAFHASLEHIQGIYVPYHLYDFDVSGWANYLGKETETRTDRDGNTHSVTYYYDVRRAGRASFSQVPVDGSSKMPDAHMDAISPFDFSQLRPFSADYVAGYLSEIADESADECAPRAIDRVKKSFEDDLASDARQGIDSVEVRQHQTDIRETGRQYCMLPVWLMHCTWEQEQMLFAINGETGKCIGNLPIDGGKRTGTIIGTLLASLLVCLAIVFLFLTNDGTESVTGYVIGAVIISAIITFVVDGHFTSQMRTAVEATTARMSYTDGGLHVTERWRSSRRRTSGGGSFTSGGFGVGLAGPQLPFTPGPGGGNPFGRL